MLRQYMRKNGVTLRELVAVADVNIITLCLKMLGIKRWKLTETVKICCFFRTSDVEHLFHKNPCLVCPKIL